MEATSLAHARERAANIARGMMERHDPKGSWSQWHIVIETPDEGRIDDPFPAATSVIPRDGQLASA